MSLSEILQKLAPKTPKPLIERFVPYLALAMPRYGINSPLRQAAFLATICYESQYFQKTKEGRARAGTKARKYQDVYWSSGYYGRGLIQLTHKENYQAFKAYVLGSRGPDLAQTAFLDNFPDSVAEPGWAVESACWYWQTASTRNFNLLADAGNFFGIQGLVNKGSINKQALGYVERLRLYKLALKLLTPAAPSVPADQPSDPENLSGTSETITTPIPPPGASPTFSQKLKATYSAFTSWFDSSNAVINQNVQRKDAAKSTWSVIGGGISHAFWALTAFFLGIPKEMYLTVAIIVGILLIIYLVRQVYLGGIREKKI